jgi:hypothetical protein
LFHLNNILFHKSDFVAGLVHQVSVCVHKKLQASDLLTRMQQNSKKKLFLTVFAGRVFSFAIIMITFFCSFCDSDLCFAMRNFALSDLQKICFEEHSYFSPKSKKYHLIEIRKINFDGKTLFMIGRSNYIFELYY